MCSSGSWMEAFFDAKTVRFFMAPKTRGRGRRRRNLKQCKCQKLVMGAHNSNHWHFARCSRYTRPVLPSLAYKIVIKANASSSIAGIGTTTTSLHAPCQRIIINPRPCSREAIISIVDVRSRSNPRVHPRSDFQFPPRSDGLTPNGVMCTYTRVSGFTLSRYI